MPVPFRPAVDVSEVLVVPGEVFVDVRVLSAVLVSPPLITLVAVVSCRSLGPPAPLERVLVAVLEVGDHEGLETACVGTGDDC